MPSAPNLEDTYLSEVYEYSYDFPQQDWTSTAKTCATIIGNQYSGVGTVTITRPGGTLTGVYATSNVLPVPHDHEGVLHITGGTGLYEDASRILRSDRLGGERVLLLRHGDVRHQPQVT